MADICTNACYAIGSSLVRPFNCSILNILNISTVIVILFYLIYPSICLKRVKTDRFRSIFWIYCEYLNNITSEENDRRLKSCPSCLITKKSVFH